VKQQTALPQECVINKGPLKKNTRIILINEPISPLRNESIRINRIEFHTRIAQRMARNTHSATRDEYTTEIETEEILGATRPRGGKDRKENDTRNVVTDNNRESNDTNNTILRIRQEREEEDLYFVPREDEEEEQDNKKDNKINTTRKESNEEELYYVPSEEEGEDESNASSIILDKKTTGTTGAQAKTSSKEKQIEHNKEGTTISATTRMKVTQDNIPFGHVCDDIAVDDDTPYIQIYCQNVSGIFDREGIGLDSAFNKIKQAGADIFTFNETHGDESKAVARRALRQSKQRMWRDNNEDCKIVHSSSKAPVLRFTKPGGNLVGITGSLVGRIRETITDPYGRWCGYTLIGKDTKEIMVLTAYKVLQYKNAKVGEDTLFNQQIAP
jgi:hypothetical protein